MRAPDDRVNYELIFNSTGVVMTFTDDEGVILDVNQAWVKSFGIPREQAIGKTAAELGIWANLIEREACLDLLVRNASIQDFEALLVTPSGPRPHMLSGRCLDSSAKRHVLWEFRDITDFKRAQTQVSKLSMAVEQSPVSVVITDLTGRIEFVNDAFVRVSGYSREEAIGQNPRILNSGLTPRDIYPKLWNTLTQGLVWEGEFINRHKGGSIYHDHATISPIRQIDGQVTHYAAVQQDVTQQLLAQQRLTYSESRFHALFDNMSSGVAIYRAMDDGADFLIVDFNRAAAAMEQVSREEVVGKRLSQIFPGVKEFGLLDVLQRVYKTGQPEHHPVSVYKDDRIHGWRDNHVYRLLTAEVVAVYDDVTTRKQAEKSLQESNQQLFSLLNSMAEGAYGADAKGQFTFVNQAFLRLLGYAEADELIGRSAHELIHHSHADGSPYPAHECPMNSGYRNYQAVHNAQDTFWRRDGTPMAVESWSQPFLIDGIATGSVVTFLDITERNQAERITQQITRQLRLDQERFRDFSISASDWFWETDARHRFCYFSDNFEKIYGLALDYLLGKSRQEILELDTLNEPVVVQAHLAQLAAHEPFRNFEYQIRVANGEVRWVSVSGIPHVDADGRFAGYRGIGTIITERKHAEVELRTVKERLEAAAAAGIVGLWDWDVPNNRLIWDSVMYQLYGIREQDWGGTYEAWTSAIHPEDKAYTEGEIQAALRGEREYAPEFRVIWPDGSIHHIKAASHTSFDELGNPLRMIGVNYDMTELKNVQKLLEEKMRLLGTILDNSSVGITFVQNRRLVKSNQRMGDIFGYTQAEMSNQSTRMFYSSQESYEELGRLGYETLARGESYISEREMRRKDGSLVWTRLSGKSIDTANLDLGSIWVFEDIAQQKQTQMQLEAAKESAEAANLSKSRFLATMSHEIRTPMNGILGMAQMLLMPDLKEDRRGDYARTILSSGQTLLILLNDILDLSKIEAGKFRLESTAFDPETMMHETTNLFAGAVQDKGLQLDCQWHGASGQRYLADSHRLRQMLSNLVGNAIKFTRAGQVRIEASEIECTENTCVLEFAVSDTGIGIPADKLDLLFKPFSQTDSSTTREFGGTGLGLSIVRNLAKAMQGDVGVSSQPGQGSRFWFRVQVQRITETQDSRKSERLARVNHPADAHLSVTSLCGHVLVAEDNLVNCMVIESLLNSLGITVSVVHDGQQSVEFIERASPAAKGDQSKRPDLILMDLHMPVMDGYMATQRIRQWEVDNQHARLPIIALTADAFEEDRQRCLAIGMDDFLSKPIALEALKSALAKWLPAGAATPAMAKPPVSHKPVDVEAFTALVTELTPLLQENKFTAITRFKSLQNLVRDTHLADEIETLASMLQELRFAQVLTRLRVISPNCAGIES